LDTDTLVTAAASGLQSRGRADLDGTGAMADNSLEPTTGGRSRLDAGQKEGTLEELRAEVVELRGNDLFWPPTPIANGSNATYTKACSST
jgi:hypothetical protein